MWQNNGSFRAVAPQEKLCPVCREKPVSSIRILPLDTTDLDQAVQLRRERMEHESSTATTAEDDVTTGATTTTTTNISNINHKEEGVKLRFHDEAPPEASYLLLSHGGSEGRRVSLMNDYQRVGRWADEEKAYADFLVDIFDSGALAMEPDIKLGTFLGEVLLCKNSRLTKKMKHAKLSVRSYELSPTFTTLDYRTFSQLEQRFLDSMPLRHQRLEMKFHLTRLWRSHLANFCLCMKSKLVDFVAYVQSLEEMEIRADQVEEIFRNLRRQHVHKMLGTKIPRPIEPAIFPPASKRYKSETGLPGWIGGAAGSLVDTNSEAGLNDELFSDIIQDNDTRPDDDYTKLLADFVQSDPHEAQTEDRNTKRDPFLNDIVSMLEDHDLPFQHADVWIPSLDTNNSRRHTILLHAGSVTRPFASIYHFAKIDALSDVSTNFSFVSGLGLPGQAFANGKIMWDTRLHKTDPRFCGSFLSTSVMKTGLGLVLPAQTARMVVCFYSTDIVPEDPKIVEVIRSALSQLCPKIKWKPRIVSSGSRTTSFSIPSSQDAARIGTDDSSTSESATSTRSNNDSSVSIPDEETVDQEITSLLGQHVPLSFSKEDGRSEPLVPFYMSLRLLLLQSSARRSREEKDVLAIIRKSFVGYSRSSKRSDEEIAQLLVRDWQYLAGHLTSRPGQNQVEGVPMAPKIMKFTPPVSRSTPRGLK